MASESKMILLVDDDPELLEVEESFLSRPGVEIKRAASGNEAVAALRAGLRPDLILSDLNMPDGTGIDLVRFVRANGDICDIPVIVLSGSGNQQEIDTVIDAGCTFFLPKPIKGSELLARVAECMEVRVREAERREARLPALLTTASGDLVVQTRNLSQSGLSLETRARLELGREYRLELILPAERGASRLDLRVSLVRSNGRVRDDHPVCSYGAKTVSMSEQSRITLSTYLERSQQQPAHAPG